MAVSLFENGLESPVGFVALAPLSAVYVLEKAKQFSWFAGVTLPVLLVAASTHWFVWIDHKIPQSPALAVGGAAIVLAISLFFLIVRLWTWNGQNLTVR